MEVLSFFRVTSFLSTIGIIFPNGTPNTFKVILSFMISSIVINTIDVEISQDINTYIDLLLIVAKEITIGIILGYIINIFINILKFIGSLIDQQIGLNMISIFDPTNNSQSTLIENIMYFIGVLLFFGIDGHLLVIYMLIHTFEIIPIASNIYEYDFIHMIKVFIELFEIGFKISAPIIICLLVCEGIMGLISRSVPQLNVMVMSIPFKILAGIILFVISLPVITNMLLSLIRDIPSMYENILNQANVAPLMFMLSTDKTEKATPKKKREQRKKGNIAKSKEVSSATILAILTIMIPIFSPYIFENMKDLLTYFLSTSLSNDLNLFELSENLMIGIKYFIMMFLPISMMILLFGVVSNLGQVGFLFTGDTLKPSLSKINPISGFKNMFSMKSVGEMFKSILIVIILGYIGVSFFKENYIDILKISNLQTKSILETITMLMYSLMKDMCIASIIIAIIDYVYQKYHHNKSMKMSKEGIKEEYKQMEGDPLIKSKIKQKQREMAQSRMMSEVSKATVIINNPTHISVALRYETDIDKAPILVAKGCDNVALKIRELASEHEIPMIENKPLARLIYKKVDIEQEIPHDMYEAVAEILIMVYKIKNRYKG